MRIFLWRVGHNLLPTNSKIDVVNPITNSLCLKCRVVEETLTYALSDCTKIKEVLIHGGVERRIFSSDWTTCIEWIESTIRLLDKSTFECFVMVLWNIWNTQNNLLCKACMDDPKVVWTERFSFARIFAFIISIFLP